MRREGDAAAARGVAGSLESCDAMVVVSLLQEGGVDIRLESPSLSVCGERMKGVILETLEVLGVHAADVDVRDRGALDCTLSARVEAAVLRARRTEGNA